MSDTEEGVEYDRLYVGPSGFAACGKCLAERMENPEVYPELSEYPYTPHLPGKTWSCFTEGCDVEWTDDRETRFR